MTCKSVQEGGQYDSQLRTEAEELFTRGKYRKAYPLWEILHNKNPENLDFKYKLGVCCLHNSRLKGKAVIYLRDVINQDSSYSEAYYYLGKAYHYTFQFDNAIASFETYLKQSPQLSEEKREEVEREIEVCQNARQQKDINYNYQMDNLGATINTRFPEYAPTISTDESVLVFTSRREGNLGGLQDKEGNPDTEYGSYFEDIYISINAGGEWKSPVAIGDHINTRGHDANIGLSPDGNQLFIYRSDSVRWGNIFVCEQYGEGWSSPRKLPAPINTEYWEGSASLTPDGQVLYFASNRPGGEGKRDIYRVRRLPNGQWGDPENLGPEINTPYPDDVPFIHPDGQTLYFGSKGHNTMGGFDIFMSSYEDGEWSEPKNLGRPVNSPEDDLYFTLSADGERAYTSTDRLSGYGQEDIYRVKMPEKAFKPEVITLLKGQVKAGGSPIKARVTVRNNNTDELQGVYYTDTTTGKYLIAVPAGANYNITFETEGYLFSSENVYFPKQDSFIEINKNIELLDGEIGNTTTLKNIFFEEDGHSLDSRSYSELDRVKELLADNPSLKVQVGSYFNPEKQNKALASKRAKQIKNYLVNQGIHEDRLRIETAELKNGKQEAVNGHKTDIKLVGGFLESAAKEQETKLSGLPEEVGEKSVLNTIYFGANQATLRAASNNTPNQVCEYLPDIQGCV
jgi:outer membrane protein OmpA-like peptidoglycan-associated protein